jgi:hypothetical protein
VPHFPEAGQGFDVDVEKIARPLPLVALHWRFGPQVSQPTRSEPVESTGHGRERNRLQPGDVPEMQALVAEIHGLLQLLRIERPPLGAACAASIRQRGRTASAVPGQPAVGAAEADSVLGREPCRTAALLQVLNHKPVPPPLCQAGSVVAMHGCVRSGSMGRTSTRSGLTPPC